MKSLFLCFTIFISLNAHALGGISGGGGKSVVCRGPDGHIRSAEVLDLYEGRAAYGLTYTESSASADDQVMQVMKDSGIGTAYSNPNTTVVDWYRNTLSHMRILPAGTALVPTDDSLEVIAPKDCAIEQTVNYQSDELVLVNGEIWLALSETQKAALLIHEASYRVFRGFGETDSRRARHFTAYLFSGGKVADPYPGNDYVAICSSSDPAKKGTSFYVSPPVTDAAGVQTVRLSFWTINDRKVVIKSTVDLKEWPHRDPSDKGLIDLLRNPATYAHYQFQTKTQSAFEGGDGIEIYVGQGVGPTNISLESTSSVDGRTMTTDLKCWFPR
jgi:hypothetical protein